MTKRIITEEQVIQHIRTHMDIWCKSYGSHVLEKHVNIPEKTMLSRIGTTENNHFIKSVSSFYDETDGQQIMDLLQRALESEAQYIAKWCNYSKRAWLGLNFYGLPDGITAKACRYVAQSGLHCKSFCHFPIQAGTVSVLLGKCIPGI